MLQKTFKPPDCPRKSSRKLLPSQTRPWQRSLGGAPSTAADGSLLGVLTGLSQLCPLSSPALWQALRLPHLAVVRSSGPRLPGTFRPPRACRRLPPCAPRVLLPALPPSGAPSPARRGSAHPGPGRAARRQPGHVRGAAIGPSQRGRAAREGRGGSKRSDSLFPQPWRGRKRKRKPVELVFLGEEANWPSR